MGPRLPVPLRDPLLASGIIPDLRYAVDSPRRVSSDESTARRVLELVASFPVATWGRDEQRTGEMWNSNSLTAWLLARSGHDTETDLFRPPAHGRAPGWSAGLAVAARATDARALGHAPGTCVEHPEAWARTS